MTRQPTPGVHERFAASLDESGLTSGFGANAAPQDKQSPGNRTVTGRTARGGDRHPLPPIINLAADDDCFTVVFRGNLRKLQGNPHRYETQFGQVVSIGVGNAFAEASEQQQPVAWRWRWKDSNAWVLSDQEPATLDFRLIEPLFIRTPPPSTHLVGDIPPHVRDFLGKVQGVCMGVAMSGDAHPNPDQVLMELFEEAQAILFPETNR